MDRVLGPVAAGDNSITADALNAPAPVIVVVLVAAPVMGPPVAPVEDWCFRAYIKDKHVTVYPLSCTKQLLQVFILEVR